MIARTGRLTRLAETAGVMALNKFGPKLAVAGAAMIGLTLPEQPLLNRTYLGFATILLLIGWLRWRGEGLAQLGRWCRDAGWC